MKTRFHQRVDRTSTRIIIYDKFGNAEVDEPFWEGYFIQSVVSKDGIHITGSIYELGRKIGVLCNAQWSRHLPPLGVKIVTGSGYIQLENGNR